MWIVTLAVIHLACVYASVYDVPAPTIKVLEPKGFRVSIPDEEGIQIFAFHGNINKPMNGLEAGEFSRDITKSENGKWVFEDRNTKLKKGDVIFYWLFVIKDHLGYRYDNGQFRVGDTSSISDDEEEDSYAPSILASPPTTPAPQSVHNSDAGFQIAAKVTDLAAELYKDIKVLRETNSILKELILKNDTMARTLKFEGQTPGFEDAEYAVQLIIEEKLKISVPVISAVRNHDKSLTFTVASLDDKVYLIRTAKKILIGSKIKLVY